LRSKDRDRATQMEMKAHGTKLTPAAAAAFRWAEINKPGGPSTVGPSVAAIAIITAAPATAARTVAAAAAITTAPRRTLVPADTSALAMAVRSPACISEFDWKVALRLICPRNQFTCMPVIFDRAEINP
jgi:hypothetical protein